MGLQRKLYGQRADVRPRTARGLILRRRMCGGMPGRSWWRVMLWLWMLRVREEAYVVGVLRMRSKDMRGKRKGVAVENGLFLGDGLWRMDLS